MLFAATLKADTDQWNIVVGGPIAWMQQQAWLFIPVAVVVHGIAQQIRRFAGRPTTWKAVHLLLDQFRDRAFPNISNDPLDHHRVTLFRYRRWCLWPLRRWPWSGWLIPVERSGYLTRRSGSVFRVPDQADDAEGIAGLAYRTGGVIREEDLPDVTQTDDPELLRLYASRTGVTEAWVRTNRPKARSYCGIHIEVGGRPWGVIVLDSRGPDTIRQRAKRDFRDFGRLLGAILEGV